MTFFSINEIEFWKIVEKYVQRIDANLQFYLGAAVLNLTSILGRTKNRFQGRLIQNALLGLCYYFHLDEFNIVYEKNGFPQF